VADALAVYGRLLAARVRSDAQYRTSFVLYLVGQTLAAGLDLAVIFVLFANVDALAGWTRPEVVLLYGLGTVAFGLADIFVSQVELAGRHIQAGTFDLFLIRPASPLLQLCAQEFALRRVGRVLQPLVALAVVLPRLGIVWNPARALFVVVAVASGTVIFASVWVITSSVSFWTVGSQETANAFTYGGSLLSQYPVDLFGTWLRRFVVFVVPMAFVSYLPAAWLLGRPSPLGMPSWIGLASPAVAAALALVARLVWRTAIRRYRGTGS
jgi:ABC-2 type transport system permease protein